MVSDRLTVQGNGVYRHLYSIQKEGIYYRTEWCEKMGRFSADAAGCGVEGELQLEMGEVERMIPLRCAGVIEERSRGLCMKDEGG